ncbi:MAG TPA: allantoate amidohydrolase [Verrucomicrobiae bacterium]|jgi:allantoate deiminase|nr:allantoate amidohydrolase [Verrucomicrobiae bacterium]
MQRIEAVERIVDRLESLGKISEEPDRLTRTFASQAMRRANDLVGSWMTQAGMIVRQDAVGNLIGHYPSVRPDSRKLLLGSHLDTVRNAGKFDGALGVLLAIACIEQLRNPVPFSIEVIAFADEEGVRFQSTYLGSRAVAGVFDVRDLERIDAGGTTMAECIRAFGGDPACVESCRFDAKDLIGYVEAHIEQGPVLESRGHAIGIVSAIAGQTRAQIDFQGIAGHAGTVPMASRKDAFCAAAEFTLAVEQQAREISELVATVGQVAIEPNASNVIPGFVRITLDVRSRDDATRQTACESLRQTVAKISQRRQVRGSWQIVQENPSTPCSQELSALLRQAAAKHQPNLITLPSGAGHDAAVMAKITPVAMLFVRCRGGVSHHPDESATSEDMSVALGALSDFISLLASRHEDV